MSTHTATPPTTLPVDGPTTTPFWRTELHELDSVRSTEELPPECDVLIVGVGYAGVSTAYHLLDEAGPDKPSVVMLEAREACSGASGRNGGHIKPDVYYNIPKYARRYGAEAAASFARFEAANVLAVRDLVEREHIDCDFVLTRAVDAYLDDEHARATEDAYRELLRTGAADLGDVCFTKGPEAEDTSRVKGARCCFSYTAASLWPYKLVMALLARLVARGVNVQTRTPATSVADAPDADGRWLVATPRGPVRARRLVYATNAYTAALAPQFHGRIVPVRGICSRIVVPPPAGDDAAAPPPPPPPPPLGRTYSLRYGPAQYDYLVQRPDGSVVVGGAKQRFWDDRAQWYGVVDDARLIEPARGYFDGLMQRRFRGWEASRAAVDAVWTGIMGWTSDFMPYVGAVPGRPGQFVNAGFSGHGMPIIFLASRGLARMVAGGASFESTGLPALFEPTEARLASQVNEILGITTSNRANV